PHDPPEILQTLLHPPLVDIHPEQRDGSPHRQPQRHADPVDDRPPQQVEHLERQHDQERQQRQRRERGLRRRQQARRERVERVQRGEDVAVELGLEEEERAADGAEVRRVRVAVVGVQVEQVREGVCETRGFRQRVPFCQGRGGIVRYLAVYPSWSYTNVLEQR
ncbi:MAG: hypothetical protein Q9214_004471, partial [Letrouitia sp. 1 TL-2023]